MDVLCIAAGLTFTLSQISVFSPLFMFQWGFWWRGILPAVQRYSLRPLHRQPQYLRWLVADAGRDRNPDHRWDYFNAKKKKFYIVAQSIWSGKRKITFHDESIQPECCWLFLKLFTDRKANHLVSAFIYLLFPEQPNPADKWKQGWWSCFVTLPSLHTLN